jgi:regulator of sirC expression with transglutaminase-like and TPR domain
MEANSAERLKRLMSGTESDLNLAEAALLLGKEEYPDLDVDAYLKRLDQLALTIQQRLPPRSNAADVILALNEYLFEELGFTGNADDYYDPRNSFLNEVLDRKLGIPITLSVVYLEIGKRLGLPLEGVSFPGHFLVKYATDEGEVVLDPFAGGMPVSDNELVERLIQLYGEQAPEAMPLPRLLEPTDKKEILVRILRNIKNVYLQCQQFD